ncbi:MAG: hypothetical protein WCY97_07255 [Methanothrix sp.]|jgi:hypothetical protein|nr:hypothetical protein [Methanothrix harundinacea]MDD2637715.1 hypothetical protein [Methanothrix sp.]MDD3709073.1 hypothetical protein [Methanothrix sp.]MDD5767290.1 hypothetical protein [Methanothrix sp.]MDI9399602.1 hypothetical protein [Euryarchaeota archaeon]
MNEMDKRRTDGKGEVKMKMQEEVRSPNEQKGRLMRGRREMPSHLNRRSGDLSFPLPFPLREPTTRSFK